MCIFDGLFGGDEMDSQDDSSGVGYNMDGTFGVPVEAVQVNDPSNTAGYPTSTDSGALDVLKYGIGIVADTWKFNQALDYKRFEATQGGLFQEGQSATVPRVASGGISPTFIFAGIAVVVLVVLSGKNG